jgi:NaMN:DMB phosphoribosyltransferase
MENPLVTERIAGDSIGLGESGTAGPSAALGMTVLLGVEKQKTSGSGYRKHEKVEKVTSSERSGGTCGAPFPQTIP